MDNRMMKRFCPMAVLLFVCLQTALAQHPTDDGLTLRPLLQQMGQRLLQNKTGSIVAIEPATGKVLCLATNSPQGPDDALAIATAYAPGSTIKTAQALTLLSMGLIDENTRVACYGSFRDGNIRVGCHRHPSPLGLVSALAVSCNTWFLSQFMAMLNDRFLFDDKNDAITQWHDCMQSMGLGGPLGVDLPGEKGGLLPNVGYLARRYPKGWNARTIMWVGMGQGDITATPLQLANLAVSIANRGWFRTPHIHTDAPPASLEQRFTKVDSMAYDLVVRGMRQAVLRGTCTAANSHLFTVCGKTGTVENSGKDHSVFIGFAPMDNPKIAIAVLVEHGGFGADLAAPMASVMMELYLKGKLTPAMEQRAVRLENKVIAEK